MSGRLASANPRRIKATHRRRWKAASGQNVYQHTDALGSPVAVTDQNRNVIERFEYEPYGKVINSTPKDGPGYTGHVLDAATGMNYMQQRYYDPGIGRFLSVDPVSANPTNGNNFNRYAYANNNPYRFTDPDGRNAVTAFGGVIYETGQFLQGNGFDGGMVAGALADGYNGEGGGFASAAIEDATTFVPAGAIAGAAIKLSRVASQAAKVVNAAKANKIHHIFSKEKHNLGGVVKSLGGEKKAFNAIEKATNKAVDTSKAGRFETTVKVGGEQVTVTGSVANGQAKIGTAFVKEELKRK